MVYYFIILSSCILLYFVSIRFGKGVVKTYPNFPRGRINKHGDIYEVIGDDIAFLKFYNIKTNKWIFALEICDTDVVGVKGVRPRRFKRIQAITLGHKIDINMFIHLHVNMVKNHVFN